MERAGANPSDSEGVPVIDLNPAESIAGADAGIHADSASRN